MKKYLLFISILFLSLISLAKDGYTLNFVTENLQGKTIEISYYYGSSKIFYSKDIVPITENKQTVFLKDTNKIKGGIFKLNFIGQKEKKDIIVDNGDHLTFKIDTISMAQLKSLNSEKNKLFFKYSATKKKDIIETFLMKFPKSVGALYFQLEKSKKNIPAYFSKRGKYQETFWKSINLDDTKIQRLPNTFSALNTYSELQPINDSNYSKSMNMVLNSIKTSSNFEYFLTWFFKNMRYQQAYNLDNTFVNTYKKYFDTLKIEFENVSNFRSIEKTYDDVNANLKGEKISDFKFWTKDDSAIELSKIYPEYDYTFIAFYDPDCFHCQKAMPRLSVLFSELNAKKMKKIATVGMLNAYDKYGWQTFITQNNMKKWINLYSLDPNKAYQEDFNSYANPKFFLVDKNGILLSRSGDTEILYRIINKK